MVCKISGIKIAFTVCLLAIRFRMFSLNSRWMMECNAPMNAKASTKGFTLVEVLTIMLIVAILASIGLPGMNRMLENNRLSANTNRLVSSLYAARSEAVKRNTSAVICTRNIAGNACGGAGTTWNDGWIVFVDIDGDGVRDANEDLLNVVEKTDIKIKVLEEPVIDMVFVDEPINISFSEDGMVDADGDGEVGEIVQDRVYFHLGSEPDRRIIRLGSIGAIRACDPNKPNCP
ncbi:MAG: hypothetical protein DSZ28_09270 [Thiothrix sp.]|nr:MAG: hypothetical protein DSZ28_09270 [Thiothrix sp.]